MPNYTEIMSDYSSLVSEYQQVYTSQTEQLVKLQNKLQSIYEQSGFSKLHKIMMSDAFVEYQNLMRYLAKVYNGIIPTLVVQKSVNSSQSFSSMKEDATLIPASIGKWFTTSLLQKMLDDDFVAGETSVSEQYIEEVASELGWPTTMNWLNTVYLDNYTNSDILIGLMHCISHFDYENVKPAGPTMALGVLQHEDDFVKDYAIRAFENWNDMDAIPILKSLTCEAKWLQSYVNQVIASLESE